MSNPPANIFLIGPMGAGKTTIGQKLAQFTGLTFYDSDQELQRSSGVNLAWIVEIEKEEGLRLREQRVLKKLIVKKGIVLATGGGTVLLEKNRQMLQTHGFIVYLRASIRQQQYRTRHAKDNRPLLDTKDLNARILELHKKRAPLYESIAGLIFDTDRLSSYQVAKSIYNELKARDFFDK